MQDAKRRALLFLAAALFLSAVAGCLFMQKVSAVDASLGEYATVYVAAKNISARELLNRDVFKPAAMPRQFLPQSAVTDLSAVPVEKNSYPIQALISVVPLQEGDLLTANILKPQGNLSSDKHRMVTLSRSDRVIFDGTFDFNDRVDIIVSERAGNSNRTDIFMTDVPVVALGRDTEGNLSVIGLEMTLEESREFIHKQNFAISIRVLKAPNSGGKAASSGGKGLAIPAQTRKKNAAAPGQNGSGDPMHTGEGAAHQASCTERRDDTWHSFLSRCSV